MNWRIAADTGGTFTDCHALDPQGRESRCKVLSTGHLRAVWDRKPSFPTRLSGLPPLPAGFLIGFQIKAIGDVEVISLVGREPQELTEPPRPKTRETAWRTPRGRASRSATVFLTDRDTLPGSSAALTIRPNAAFLMALAMSLGALAYAPAERLLDDPKIILKKLRKMRH